MTKDGTNRVGKRQAQDKGNIICLLDKLVA